MTTNATTIPAFESYRVVGNERFPNSALPVLVYRGVAPGDADAIEAMLRANQWAPAWRADIGFYPFDHFHSNAHEVVVLAAGEARGRVGGPGGPTVALRAGDAIVLPAGVCHFGAFSSPDIQTIGAYPVGAPAPDMRRGDPAELALTRGNAARTPLPAADPIFGGHGPLVREWSLGPG